MLSKIMTPETELTAFRPDPAATIGKPLLSTVEERLADAETRFMRIAIERFVNRSGPLADLARSIIVLRAEVASRAQAQGKSHV